LARQDVSPLAHGACDNVVSGARGNYLEIVGLEQVVDRFSDTVRRHGMSAALHDLECRVLNKVTRFEILRGMVVEPDDITDPTLFDAPGYEGRFVDPVELEPLAHARQHELDLGFLEQAIRRNDRCYAMFEGNALAAYGWYAQRPTPIDEHFELHFDDAYTYMFKGYTVPAYRGKRLHAVAMCRALRALAGEGRRGLVSYVASNNFASLKSTARMGYRVFGDVYLVQAAGRSLTWATPGCRSYGFRVEVRNDRPY
jgi:hypothetical protein